MRSRVSARARAARRTKASRAISPSRSNSPGSDHTALASHTARDRQALYDRYQANYFAKGKSREVIRLVAIIQRLPAILHVTGRHVAGERVASVVAHEPREIAVIPIGGGALQHRGNFLRRIAERDFRR